MNETWDVGRSVVYVQETRWKANKEKELREAASCSVVVHMSND